MPFQKGQSGNPKGRPKKGDAFTDLLRDYLEKPHKKGLNKTRYLHIIEMLYEMACTPDIHAIKYIFDRIDGKPRETHALEGTEEGPLEVTFTIKDAKNSS